MGKIKEGAPAALGFGAPRREKTPGMALVALVSADHAKSIGQLTELKPDAAIVVGVDGPAAVKGLFESMGEEIPWGALVSSLGDEDAQAYEEGGSDLVAFSLQGTTVAAVGSEKVAKILCLNADIDLEEIRSINALPVDVVLLSVPTPSDNQWTLEDLAMVARFGQRLDKYLLIKLPVPISRLPAGKELEALRNTGVDGLVVDVGAASPESLSELKGALLEMPRQRPNPRDRAMALLPRSAFPSGATPEPEEPEPDEDDE